MQRITPNLWINDGKIEEAVAFYCSLFEDSGVVSSTDYGPDAGEYAGQKMALYFELRASPTSRSTVATPASRPTSRSRWRSRATPRRRSTDCGTPWSRAASRARAAG